MAARLQHPPSAGGPMVRTKRDGLTVPLPPEDPLNGASELLLSKFGDWLRDSMNPRGLKPQSARRYLPWARRYVAWYMYTHHTDAGPGPGDSIWPQVQISEALVEGFHAAHLGTGELKERKRLTIYLTNYTVVSAALGHFLSFLWMVDGNEPRGDLPTGDVPEGCAREGGASRGHYHIPADSTDWAAELAKFHKGQGKNQGQGLFAKGAPSAGKRALRAAKKVKAREDLTEGNVDFFQMAKSGSVQWDEMDAFLGGLVREVIAPSRRDMPHGPGEGGSGTNGRRAMFAQRGAWRDAVRKDARLHAHMCCALHLNGRPVDGFNRRLAEFWASPYSGGLNPYVRCPGGATTFRLFCSEHKMSSRKQDLMKEALRHRIAHWCFPGSIARAHFLRWHGPGKDAVPDVVDLPAWLDTALYPAVAGAKDEHGGKKRLFAKRTERMQANTETWLETRRSDACLTRSVNWTDKSMHLRRISNGFQISQGDADITALTFHGGWDVPAHNRVAVAHYIKAQPPRTLSATAGCMFDAAQYHTQWDRDNIPVSDELVRLYCPWKEEAAEALRPELRTAMKQRASLDQAEEEDSMDRTLTTTRNRHEVIKTMTELAKVFWQDSAILAAELYKDTSEMEGPSRDRADFFEIDAFRSSQNADMLVPEFRVMVRKAMLRMTAPGERAARFPWLRSHASEHGDEPEYILEGSTRGQRVEAPFGNSGIGADQLALIARDVATQVVDTLSSADAETRLNTIQTILSGGSRRNVSAETGRVGGSALPTAVASPDGQMGRATGTLPTVGDHRDSGQDAGDAACRSLTRPASLKAFYDAWLDIGRTPTRSTGAPLTPQHRKRIRDTRSRFRAPGQLVGEILERARGLRSGDLAWDSIEECFLKIVAKRLEAGVEAGRPPLPPNRLDVGSALRWASGIAQRSLGRRFPGYTPPPAPDRAALLDEFATALRAKMTPPRAPRRRRSTE